MKAKIIHCQFTECKVPGAIFNCVLISKPLFTAPRTPSYEFCQRNLRQRDPRAKHLPWPTYWRNWELINRLDLKSQMHHFFYSYTRDSVETLLAHKETLAICLLFLKVKTPEICTHSWRTGKHLWICTPDIFYLAIDDIQRIPWYHRIPG